MRAEDNRSLPWVFKCQPNNILVMIQVSTATQVMVCNSTLPEMPSFSKLMCFGQRQASQTSHVLVRAAAANSDNDDRHVVHDSYSHQLSCLTHLFLESF